MNPMNPMNPKTSAFPFVNTVLNQYTGDQTTSAPPLQWDLFCQVIDNYGDIGVCWRLAHDLAQRGQQVRLWTDDASALAWMAPHGCAGVSVRAWGSGLQDGEVATDVLIEAFGCEPPTAFVAALAQQAQQRGRRPVWVNLEYLSAESYVERCHGLPSPVQQGSAAGWQKWFFYPGFTPATGGLLCEPDLAQRQAQFDVSAWRAAYQRAHALCVAEQALWVSMFCYEPPALPTLLAQALQAATPMHWLVAPGRPSAAVRQAWPADAASTGVGALSVAYLPAVSQSAFDERLWACDLNFVRGEDSLVRALWAGKPLVWHIYPQDDAAHHDKLQAFLDWLQAPPSLRQFHAVWNGVVVGPLPTISASLLAEWGACVAAARSRLLLQRDLLTQLLGFCCEKR